MTDQSGRGQVRVVLIGCTGLLGDIIGRAVAEQPDLDIVGEYAEPTAGAADADLVVWNNADEAAVTEWLTLLRQAPRVLATVGDGRDASLWELTPHRTELGALSPAALVETIRQSARSEEP